MKVIVMCVGKDERMLILSKAKSELERKEEEEEKKRKVELVNATELVVGCFMGTRV